MSIIRRPATAFANAPCTIDGCEKTAHSAGMCSMHYERKRIHGDPHYKKSPMVDLAGKRFGRLTVVTLAERLNKEVRWTCRCDCGNSVIVQAGNLTAGHTQSCGCYRMEVTASTARVHGMTDTGTYRSWIAMRRRCTDPKYIEFHLYGGRGIAVCPQWMSSFEAFLADMGERPTRHSLDRIDTNGNYEPGNCRWATFSEQARNRRRPGTA